MNVSECRYASKGVRHVHGIEIGPLLGLAIRAILDLAMAFEQPKERSTDEQIGDDERQR